MDCNGEIRVGKVAGDLEVLSLREIVKILIHGEKSGVLKIGLEAVRKAFYFREGKVIFVTSTQQGERFGEFLIDIGCIDLERMQLLLEESRRRNRRFTADLIEEGVFEKKALETALSQLVIIAMADALTWPAGTFELSDVLPGKVLSGPVDIAVEDVLSKASRLQ